MTKFHNPLAPRPNRAHARSSEIKTWVRELLALSEETPITATELACREEGCPDIETVIGVLEPGKPILTLRVHAPMAVVTLADIVSSTSELRKNLEPKSR